MKTLTLDIMPHGAGWRVASASQLGTWHYVAMHVWRLDFWPWGALPSHACGEGHASAREGGDLSGMRRGWVPASVRQHRSWRGNAQTCFAMSLTKHLLL
jgi:hypothetical protein